MPRIYYEELPVVRIPRLRAEGVNTPETKTFLVRLGEVEQVVGVTLQKFPNGGSWSLFQCPMCGQKGRALWLHGGDIVATGVANGLASTIAFRKPGQKSSLLVSQGGASS